MQIILALSLPRDEQTIPVSRHIAVSAMAEIGVSEDSTHDIAVALTEACTNVLKHSGPGDEFEVSLEVDDDQCVIRVVDTGHGFDSDSLGFGHADTSAEQGRGIELMRSPRPGPSPAVIFAMAAGSIPLPVSRVRSRVVGFDIAAPSRRLRNHGT